MRAIFVHELKSYFHTLTAWLFAAFLLCFVGIGAILWASGPCSTISGKP